MEYARSKRSNKTPSQSEVFKNKNVLTNNIKINKNKILLN